MDKLPITVRRSIELLGLIAVGFILSAGKDVIMPILMAAFMSMLLLPVYRWLRKKRVPEFLAILLSLLLLVVVVGSVGIFLSFQVASLLQDIPAMQKNLNIHWNTISHWIADRWNIPIRKQLTIINKQVSGLGTNMAGTLQGAALSLTNIFVFIGLVPIYIFMLLFYKQQIRKFIMLWFHKETHEQVTEAFNETQVMVKYYLVSLLIQITYLTILLGGILLLFGIKHALLIGVAFGILNLIPYIGALVGNLLGVLLTLTSSSQLWQIWLVLGVIAFVQFLDNNILMPRIVGSKVKINSLASIVGIVIGGALAGISGMFLSIPVMAVLKIVFDKSPTLCQWGVLLAEPDTSKKKDKGPMAELKQDLVNKRNDEVKDENEKRGDK
ncbi:MAG: AI-2E family transporter [Bacteroidota bacterium]